MQRVVKKYLAFQTFFNLLLWIPVFYEFQKRMGLSDPEIFGIQSIYYVVFCFLEVPTGYLADRFGYKACVAMGAALLAFANVLPIGVPTYQGFLWHFLAVALARSLISGAASAYLYEYMKQRGESAIYKKIEGDARFWSLVARVAAWAAVGWLMALNVALPYWISAFNALVALGIAVTLPPVAPQAGEPVAATSPGRALRGGNAMAAIFEVARSPMLLLLMLQGVGLFVTARILQVNLYQPILTDKHFDVTAFGWVMSVMTVFEAVGSRFAHKLKAALSDRGAVTAMTIVIGGAMLLAGLGGKAAAVAGFCAFSLATGLAFPVQKQLINDAITQSRLRATVLSLESIVDRALCALAVLPLGGLVQAGRLPETLVVCGAVVGVAAVVIHASLSRIERKQATIVAINNLKTEVTAAAPASITGA